MPHQLQLPSGGPPGNSHGTNGGRAIPEIVAAVVHSIVLVGQRLVLTGQ